MGTLTPGTSTTVVVTSTVSRSTLAGSVQADASATSDTTDPNAANSAASATTAINTQADLAVALTAGKDTYRPSSTVTYTATVQNAGPSDAQAAVVTVTLPDLKQAIYVFDNGGCTKAGLVLTCPRGTVGASPTSFQVYVTVKGNKGVIAASSTVTSSTTDPNVANNTATRQVKIGK